MAAPASWSAHSMWATPANISGVVAWYLLALDVLLGNMVSGGLAKDLVMPKRKLALHGLVGWSLNGAVIVHIVVVTVGHAAIGLSAAPVLGITAVALLVIVTETGVTRRGFTLRQWRWFHRAAYGVLILGTAHALLAGPDEKALWFLLPGVAVLSFTGAGFTAHRYKTYVRSHARWRAKYKHFKKTRADRDL